MLKSQAVHERRKRVTMFLGEKGRGRVTRFSHFELDLMAEMDSGIDRSRC